MDFNREKEHFLALKGKIFPYAPITNKFEKCTIRFNVSKICRYADSV